jgi:hypothetical protein
MHAGYGCRIPCTRLAQAAFEHRLVPRLVRAGYRAPQKQISGGHGGDGREAPGLEKLVVVVMMQQECPWNGNQARRCSTMPLLTVGKSSMMLPVHSSSPP